MPRTKKESEPKAQDQTQVKTPEMDVKSVMDMVADLKAENQYLKNKLNQAAEQIKFMTVGEIYKRIDVLWNIITFRGANEVFGDEFLGECVEDFKEILFPKGDTENHV